MIRTELIQIDSSKIILTISSNQLVSKMNLKFIKILENQLLSKSLNPDVIIQNASLLFLRIKEYLLKNSKNKLFITRKKMKNNLPFNLHEFRFQKPNPEFYEVTKNQSVEMNLKRCLLYLILLREILNALSHDVTVEKREIYYNNVHIFDSIDTVHKGFQEICFLMGVPRSSLNIHSSAIGLFSGQIEFEAHNNSQTQKFFDMQFNSGKLNANLSQSTTLLGHGGLSVSQFTQPRILAISTGLISKELKPISTQAKLLFVVEKETVFHHLIENGFHSMFPEAVLVTGKGYPDYLTKRFVQNLIRCAPEIVPFYVGDFDPHGISIFLDYLFGSEISVFEDLFCSVLHPLGLFREDARELQGFLNLDIQDINKIHQLLDLKYFK